jgi:hypothetical protein
MSPVSAQAATDQELVNQFYPERLTLEAQRIDPAMEKESTYELADLDKSGVKNYIIAVYSNTLSGAVRLLKKQGTTAVLVAEPNLPAMSGFLPGVGLIDLDNDKIPEAMVTFSYASGNSSDWYFKWKSPHLEMIGPAKTNSRGLTVTPLSNSSPMNPDGSGVLAIVDGPHESRPGRNGSNSISAHKVYTLQNGKYVYSTSMFYSGTFIWKSGQAASQSESFTVDKTDASYTLRVLNGGLDGGTRASSAEISLNGQRIVGPDKFSQKPAVITVPITLAKLNNQITVNLKSSQGSNLYITLESRR